MSTKDAAERQTSARVRTREDAQISHHVEAPRQGGEPYVRCESCGREVIGVNPDCIRHRDDCEFGDGGGES